MKCLKLILILLFISMNSNAQEDITVNTLTSPFTGSGGLSLDNEGNLYIGDFGDFLSGGDVDGQPNSVWKLDTELNLTVYSQGFIGASGNAFDSNGVLYQSDIGAGAIYKVINGIRTFVTNTGISGPVGIIFDSNDNFYVCNCGNNTIRKVTPSGVSTLFASGNASIFNCPNGITIDENDNLYVVNFSNPNIIKITPNGATSIIGSTGAGNGHLDYDPVSNRLYIASFAGHRIFSLSLEDEFPQPTAELLAGSGVLGNTDGDATTSRFMYPNGVAVTQTGDSIYINSSTNPNISTLNPQLIRLIKGVQSGSLSVESVNPLSNLNGYPNPVTDKFLIESDLAVSSENLNLKLFDLNGKVVKEIKNIKTNDGKLKIVIDLASLAAGNYLYTIYNNSNIVNQGKLIKK